jgi:hypothetical protein
MAYEDYLASQAWRNLPPAQFNTGLLGQGQAPTPTNYYQQIMQQMAAEPANVTGTPQSAGGYKPGIFAPRTVEEMVDELNALNAAGGRGGGRSAAEQQRIDEFFDAMTPAELAEFQAKNAKFINQLLTPLPLQLADLAAKKMGYGGFLSTTLGDGLLGGERAGVVTVGEGEAVADGDGITAPSYGVISNSGLLGLSGISGPGMASTTPGNAVSSAAMGGQAGGCRKRRRWWRRWWRIIWRRQWPWCSRSWRKQRRRLWSYRCRWNCWCRRHCIWWRWRWRRRWRRWMLLHHAGSSLR